MFEYFCGSSKSSRGARLSKLSIRLGFRVVSLYKIIIVVINNIRVVRTKYLIENHCVGTVCTLFSLVDSGKVIDCAGDNRSSESEWFQIFYTWRRDEDDGDRQHRRVKLWENTWLNARVFFLLYTISSDKKKN